MAGSTEGAFPETKPEEWKEIQEQAAKIDRREQFVTIFGAPGIFEQLHYFMGMDDTLINFMKNRKPCMN